MFCSKLCFLATLLAAPFAQRWILVERHIGNLYPEISGTLLYASDAPLVATLVFWGLAQVLEPRAPLRLGPTPLTGSLLGIAALSSASAAWATATPIAGEVALRTLLLFFMYTYVIDARPNPLAVAVVLAGTAALNSSLAVAQFLRQAPLGLALVGEITWRLVGADEWLRGYGLTPHSNILGGYAAIGALCVAGMLLAGSGRLSIVPPCVGLALTTAGLAASVSRAAGLALLAAWTVIVIGLLGCHRKLKTALVATALAGSVGLTFVVLYPSVYVTRTVEPLAWLYEQAQETGPVRLERAAVAGRAEIENLRQRLATQDAALRLIRGHPWGGVGAGNFAAAWVAETSDRRGIVFQPVHNVPLLVFAELGVIGFLLWGTAHSWLFWRTMRTWPRVRKGWGLVWTAGLAGTFVVGLLDHYFWGWQQGRIVLWSLLGLWAASYGVNSDEVSGAEGGVF